MSRYLVEVAYTPESWAAQLKDPRDRREVIKPVLDSVGARLESLFYAFGDRDLIALVDAPDNVSAAAMSLAFSAGGAIKSLRTTPLMSVEDGMEAMRRGFRALSTYKPLIESAEDIRPREKIRTN
ncbi:MAG: GYD domain-containing protein [Candidatus Velthaea sp.]